MRRSVLVSVLPIVLLLAACSAPSGGARESATPINSPTAYSGLAVPVRLVPPTGMPLEIRDPHLLTWRVTTNDEDKIRVMIPRTVAPGDAAPLPAPADYHAYLLGLRPRGARITHDDPVSLGGHPGRLFTITSSRQIDSGLGCWSDRQDGCFGLPPDLVLRMATTTVDGHAVVLRARTTISSPNARVVAAFESMLPTVGFPR